MTEQQNLFEQIEDYLHDRMSEKERIAFEQKLAVDESLAVQVSEARAANEAIHFACLADLKKTVGQDIKKIKHTPEWKNLIYWFIGSAMFIGASTGLFMFTKDSKKEIAVTSENKEFAIEKSTDSKNQNSTENEFQIDKKKNSNSSNQSLKEKAEDKTESNHPSKITEKTFTKVTEKQNTTNEKTTASPIANEGDSKKTIEPTPSEIKNNCNKEFDIRTEASCKHKENGSITIFTDGGIEFIFQVDQHTANGSNGVFHNLSPGEHKILVTYNKECTFTRTVKVEEKWCPLNQPFSFNPDYHEKWEIRYDEGAEGEYIIYDRSGREIYKNTFGSGNESWNGSDMNGNTVAIGNYAAILYYSDGRKEKVDLTIIR